MNSLFLWAQKPAGLGPHHLKRRRVCPLRGMHGSSHKGEGDLCVTADVADVIRKKQQFPPRKDEKSWVNEENIGVIELVRAMEREITGKKGWKVISTTKTDTNGRFWSSGWKLVIGCVQVRLPVGLCWYESGWWFGVWLRFGLMHFPKPLYWIHAWCNSPQSGFSCPRESHLSLQRVDMLWWMCANGICDLNASARE